MCRQSLYLLNSKGIIPRRSIRDCDSEVQRNFQRTGRYKASSQGARKAAKTNREHHMMLNLQHPETLTCGACVTSKSSSFTETSHGTERKDRQVSPTPRIRQRRCLVVVTSIQAQDFSSSRAYHFASVHQARRVLHVGTALKTRRANLWRLAWKLRCWAGFKRAKTERNGPCFSHTATEASDFQKLRALM